MNNNELPNSDEVKDKPVFHVKKCPYKKGLAVCAFILSVGAIGIAIAIGGCLNSLWKEIHQLKPNAVTLENHVQDIQKKMTLLENTVETQQKSISEILSQTNVSRVHWAYAQIFYLTQQAVYQVRLDNIDGALGLLDDALMLFDDVSLPDIENKLAATIKTLRAVPKVDRDGLMSRIDQLVQQVDALPLSLPGISSTLPSIPAKNTFSGSGNFFKASWDQIKQLIVIRHHEKPTEPLISPEQNIYLKQNLQLQLEKASMAVLYRDNQLYQTSLQKVKRWVKQFFNLRANETQNFLKTTDALLQVNIAPAFPDVLPSLQAILSEIKPSLKTASENVSLEKSSPMKAEISGKIRSHQEVSE